MTTLSLNELSKSERRRLGLPEDLDLLPRPIPRRVAPIRSEVDSPNRPMLLTGSLVAWDNVRIDSK
jgi:hypothetical protein